jgi:hypothetical protein
MSMRAALLKESAETGYPIITMSRDTANSIQRMSNMVQYRQYKFPKPICLSDVKNGNLRGTDYEGLIILDSEFILKDLLSAHTDIKIAAVHYMPDFTHGDLDIKFGKSLEETKLEEDKRNHREILEKSVTDMAKKYDKLTSENNFGEAYQVLKNIDMAKRILEMK